MESRPTRRWGNHPFIKAAVICAATVALYAIRRTENVEQLRSRRFALVCGFILTGGLLAAAWEALSGARWTWTRSVLTIWAAYLLFGLLIVELMGRQPPPEVT